MKKTDYTNEIAEKLAWYLMECYLLFTASNLRTHRWQQFVAIVSKVRKYTEAYRPAEIIIHKLMEMHALRPNGLPPKKFEHVFNEKAHVVSPKADLLKLFDNISDDQYDTAMRLLVGMGLIERIDTKAKNDKGLWYNDGVKFKLKLGRWREIGEKIPGCTLRDLQEIIPEDEEEEIDEPAMVYVPPKRARRTKAAMEAAREAGLAKPKRDYSKWHQYKHPKKPIMGFPPLNPDGTPGSSPSNASIEPQ